MEKPRLASSERRNWNEAREQKKKRMHVLKVNIGIKRNAKDAEDYVKRDVR